MKELKVKSPSFSPNGVIPKRHTGFDADISPEFHFPNLATETVSIAVIMDDLDIPFLKEYCHWIIWNIPKTEVIPENIPYGTPVTSFYNAIQGIAYGMHRYRGPKQPIFVRNMHRYRFCFYSLDCFLDLDQNAKKKDLVKAMSGHILQSGSMIGTYKR